LSNRAPLESLEPLESRLLLAANLPPPIPTAPGVTAIGRTVYIIGTPGDDSIRITKAPNDSAGKAQPGKIQAQMNTIQPVFNPRRMNRFYIDAGGGADMVRVEADVPASFHAKVIIFGGDGNDTITGSKFADRIFAGAGDDLVVGFAGADEIHGGPGNDTLDGGYGRDSLFGDDGNDILIGGPCDDRLLGGPGDDSFRNFETPEERLGSGRDLVDGGGGNDTAQNDPLDRYKLINFA
jgi:Ca2+-binding RTX toxin-like protein